MTRRRTLRAQMILAFMAVAALAVAVGALFTIWGLDRVFHDADIVRVEGPDGPAVLVTDHHSVQDQIDRLHLAAALIAAAIAIGVGLLIAGRLSRPLRALADAARRLPAEGRMAALPSGGSAEITDVADELDRLAADLARRRAGRQLMAQDLAHELRTPLSLIQARIEAMQDGVRPLDADGLGALHTETLRLARLVDRIERIAEAEARPAPADTPLDLADIARAAHRSHAGAFALRDTELRLRAQEAPATGDPDALGEVVANLLANSLRYSRPAHPVELATASEDGRAVLTVTDGGVLGPDETEAVFERFRRGSAATASRAQGSGLGLTIARDTARRHGGDLVLEATATGARARLTLPARPLGAEAETDARRG